MFEPYRISIFKDSLGNECYLVIDTLFKGVSAGGVRINSEITLQEVKDLARNMSYKFALFGLPIGGAKTGIKLKDGSFKNAALINFKENLRPFIKQLLYLPGKDLGSSEDDIALIYKEILHNNWRNHSSYYTAVGMSSCLDSIKNKWSFKNLNVTLSGFGSVGYFLVKKLIAQKVNLVAISNKFGCIYDKSGLNKDKLIELKEKFDEDWIFHITKDILPKEKLYTLPADVLIPGAEAYAINTQNIYNLKTRFICPVANIPYQEGIMEKLKERQIIFFPDFITNAGGVVGAYLASWGFSFKEAEEEINSRIKNLFTYICKNSQNNYFNFALKLAQDSVSFRNKLNSGYENRGILRKKLSLSFLKTNIPNRLRRECYNLIYRKKLFVFGSDKRDRLKWEQN